MKKSVAMKWVKALRSGKYKQGRGQLRKDVGRKQFHCCLGVLCEVMKIEYDPNDYHLALRVQDIVGMSSAEGALQLVDKYSLAELNDQGMYGFKRIANIIEKSWKEL